MNGPSRRAREALLEVVEAVRAAGDGRYACVLDASGLVVESPEPQDGHLFALRQHLVDRRASLLSVPRTMEDEGRPAAEDPFAEWHQDQFLLAVLNERAALVVACPDAEALREASGELLRVWADRLQRYDARFRMDARGRGFFFGRAKLDVVVVGAAEP